MTWWPTILPGADRIIQTFRFILEPTQGMARKGIRSSNVINATETRFCCDISLLRMSSHC